MLRDPTSRGLYVRVWPPHTSERRGGGGGCEHMIFFERYCKKGAAKKALQAAAKKVLTVHRPGIEPGSLPWQGSILPLDQRCGSCNALSVRWKRAGRQGILSQSWPHSSSVRHEHSAPRV